MTVTIWHNPRCSKSRAALDLLRAQGVEPVVVEYLRTPPTADEIGAVLRKLGLGARQLLRSGEDAYRRLNLAAANLTDADLADAMAAHPELIERPVVIAGDRAVVGRPPGRALEIL